MPAVLAAVERSPIEAWAFIACGVLAVGSMLVGVFGWPQRRPVDLRARERAERGEHARLAQLRRAAATADMREATRERARRQAAVEMRARVAGHRRWRDGTPIVPGGRS